MKKIIVALALAFIGWAGGVWAQPAGTYFDINLTGLNCDIYDFNGYSGDFSDGGLNLSMNIEQQGRKLFAYGDFDGDFDGLSLDGSYTVKGALSTYQDRLKLKLGLAMRGTYLYDDYDGTYQGNFSLSLNADVSLNRLTGEMEGTLKGRGTASGLGSESFYEVISMDVPPGYGIGDTGLEILVDGDKKLVGTGTITLPDGEQVDLIATASFNGKKLQYKVQLKSDRYDAFAKGSTLAVTVTDGSVTGVSGAVLGQKVKYDAAVTKYDGTYSGTYSDQYESGNWQITADNGKISGNFSDSWDSYSVDGQLQSNGSFTFYTESRALGTGRINLKTGAVSGSYKIPAERISGKFSGALK